MSALAPTPYLFDPFTIRGLTLSNRIAVSPMCQYSSEDGFANNWHLVHLGSRAVGGSGLIMMEATAVSPIGRISPQDMGIWKQEHIPMLKVIVDFVHSQKTHIGIQLAHAGRKASNYRPWERDTNGPAIPNEEGGWDPVGPSPIPYSQDYKVPHELTRAGIEEIVQHFVDAAKRAVEAGFDLIEIHGAHGYLINNFYSPRSNKRTDEYGGSFEGRVKFCVDICKRVREVIPEDMPLFVRLSATEFVDNGWNVEDTVRLSRILRDVGVDLIDCSAGGNCHDQNIELKPGYQVPFAEKVRKEACIATAAVGLITKPKQGQEIIENGQADIVMMAREMLREPYWPQRAAKALRYKGLFVPPQYERAINL